MKHKPFKDLKVLELSSVLAGPLAGTFFAEGGAEVLKVENPVSGDVTRSWRAKGESTDSPISAYYASANTYKKVVRKDLKSEEGRVWLEEQLASTDLLLENFKLADLEKFNLSPKAVASRHPHLVHIRLVGFADQPERLAYDVVVQAETGFMHMNGDPSSDPTRMPVALIDVLASGQIRSAALSALYSRERGTTGIYSEVSLELSGVSALVNRATNYLMNSSEQNRLGSAHPNIAPYGDILTLQSGRQIVLAIGSNSQFEGLCKVLDLAHLPATPQFATNASRVKNRESLVALLQKKAGALNDVEALMSDLTSNKVPAGIIRPLSEVFGPGSAASNHLIEEEISGANRKVVKPSSTSYSTTVFGK